MIILFFAATAAADGVVATAAESKNGEVAGPTNNASQTFAKGGAGGQDSVAGLAGGLANIQPQPNWH